MEIAVDHAPFVAHFSPWRRLLGVLGCGGFVALGLWLAGAIGDTPRPAPLVGWGSAATFAAFMAIGLYRLRQRDVAIRVDDAGIRLWRPDDAVLIPWAAVREVVERRVNGQLFLCLLLDAPERYRAPGLGGPANVAMGFGDVALGVQATDARFADLRAAVQRFGGAAFA